MTNPVQFRDAAFDAIHRAMDADPRLRVTLPEHADDAVIRDALG